ncbi:MAG: hypothetical protein Q8L45_11355 [Xanthomonadaceae bacterium]|nr:hypothetical protein [Xanthomonadaceae bacterium]MDP2184466.1 hypothetical protein [Xanthomonadales bacterium]MDZ4115759.1 hypothetical protein [Xanthomonadaceae bacterium]
MDLKYIKQDVAKIEAMKGDYEMAHLAEIDLRAGFIALVAEVGSPELAAMAREVLKTDEIDFTRSCA